MRQWKLLKALESARRGISAGDLASRIEEPQSKRTLYRDLEVLQEAGFPLVNDKGTWRLLEAGEGAWSVPVNPSEVVALMLSAGSANGVPFPVIQALHAALLDDVRPSRGFPSALLDGFHPRLFLG